MKKNDYTIAMLLALTAVVVVVVAWLFVGGDGREPAHVRLKNRLHKARYSGDEATEAAVRLMLTNNRADARPFPLMQGKCGWQVEVVQRLLNRYCRAHLVEDGWWGPATERAIHAYYTNQYRYSVPVWNKFFQYSGVSYQVGQFQFEDMLKQLGDGLM